MDSNDANSNIITLPVLTKAELDPQKILSLALARQKFQRVVILGMLEDGTEYLAMSSNDLACVNWDLDRAKHAIMKQMDKQ